MEMIIEVHGKSKYKYVAGLIECVNCDVQFTMVRPMAVKQHEIVCPYCQKKTCMFVEKPWRGDIVLEAVERD